MHATASMKANEALEELSRRLSDRVVEVRSGSSSEDVGFGYSSFDQANSPGSMPSSRGSLKRGFPSHGAFDYASVIAPPAGIVKPLRDVPAYYPSQQVESDPSAIKRPRRTVIAHE